MAFVKISKGSNVLRVSSKSYDNFYKDLGYKIIGRDRVAEVAKGDKVLPEQSVEHKEQDETTETQEEQETLEEVEEPVAENEEPEETDLEETQEDDEEIPISSMTKPQLMKFAKDHNIDTSSARSVREARKMIQEAVRQNNIM